MQNQLFCVKFIKKPFEWYITQKIIRRHYCGPVLWVIPSELIFCMQIFVTSWEFTYSGMVTHDNHWHSMNLYSNMIYDSSKADIMALDKSCKVKDVIFFSHPVTFCTSHLHTELNPKSPVHYISLVQSKSGKQPQKCRKTLLQITSTYETFIYSREQGF